MIAIPLTATPCQTLNITPANQPTTLTLTTRWSTDEQLYKLYIDVNLNGSDIASSVLCRDRLMILQLEYLGYFGDFVFVDTQGGNDPTYDGLGLGERYQLYYLFPQDIGYAQLSGLIDVTSV